MQTTFYFHEKKFWLRLIYPISFMLLLILGDLMYLNIKQNNFYEI